MAQHTMPRRKGSGFTQVSVMVLDTSWSTGSTSWPSAGANEARWWRERTCFATALPSGLDALEAEKPEGTKRRRGG